MRDLTTKRYRGLVVLLITLGLMLGLAACAQNSSGTTGTISGTVVTAPVCPGAQSSTSCQPKPVTDRQVTIDNASGTTVSTTKTDSNGHFSATLAPGDYVIHVATAVGGRQITPGNVTVTANHTTTIQIVMDSGIR